VKDLFKDDKKLIKSRSRQDVAYAKTTVISFRKSLN